MSKRTLYVLVALAVVIPVAIAFGDPRDGRGWSEPLDVLLLALWPSAIMLMGVHDDGLFGYVAFAISTAVNVGLYLLVGFFVTRAIHGVRQLSLRLRAR
jgi:hypothetical protein